MTNQVLIIDDEASSRAMLDLALSEEGYALEFAANGKQGLKKAETLQPDLILLDVMMPGMTGFEVCQRIRNGIQNSEVPILLLTALDDRQSLLRGLEAGADDFISKPFDTSELRARIRGITQLNRYHRLNEERARLAQAYQDLEEAYDATLKGWTLALDLRDKETEGHSQRVVALTVQLARQFEVEVEALKHIRRGALLHDIGKIGIPDSILQKPGPLTDEEWAVMRQHPIFARDMLESIAYLRPVLDIPFSHHEKWDGTGYPLGLKADEIPFAARLFSVVDVWDALTSDRPYRPAWKKEKVIAHLREQSGKHFDPHAVEAFLTLILKTSNQPKKEK